MVRNDRSLKMKVVHMQEELESAWSGTEPEAESQSESHSTDSEESSPSSECDTGEMLWEEKKYNSYVSGTGRSVYKE